MSLSSNQSILVGDFISDGVSQNVTLPWFPTRFELLNITQFGSTAGATPVITAEWSRGMAQNSVKTGAKTNAAATIAIPEMFLTQGVRIVDTSIQTPEAPGNAITDITAASPPVITKIAHGFIVGDRIRLAGTTDMRQVASMDFTVTVIDSANSFSIGFLDTSVAPFTCIPATAGTAQRLPNDRLYVPCRRYITDITVASSAVVTMSVTHGFLVGQVVKMVCPAAFGMVEIDGLQGEITAISVANNTITLDIDSSAFTAFEFPDSATAALGISYPLVVPFGDAGNLLVGSVDNVAVFQVSLGTNAIGGNADVMQWVATRGSA